MSDIAGLMELFAGIRLELREINERVGKLEARKTEGVDEVADRVAAIERRLTAVMQERQRSAPRVPPRIPGVAMPLPVKS